jgi:5-(carboxyamino)imidazole ribonucleotide mutase
MPSGVPVATVALDGAANAGILAAQILGTSDKNVSSRIQQYKDSLRTKVEASVKEMEKSRKK